MDQTIIRRLPSRQDTMILDRTQSSAGLESQSSFTRAMSCDSMPRMAESVVSVEDKTFAGNVKAKAIELLPLNDAVINIAEYCSGDPEDYKGGFQNIPYGGFELMTYVLRGNVQFSDNKGNSGRVNPGGVQLLTAGKGVLSTQHPLPEEGATAHWSFHIWLNLPSASKGSEVKYQTFDGAAVPQSKVGDAEVRVLSGWLNGVAGPICTCTGSRVLDIHLPPASGLKLPTEPTFCTFLLLYAGATSLLCENGQTSKFEKGSVIKLKKGQGKKVGDYFACSTPAEQGCSFLMIDSPTINEPVVHNGPFVCTTDEEVQQAWLQVQAGAFGA
eukprot:TRINITY_DN21218_c0_g1_i1.p1 TRINITY_DN21218_c0_g1~~TRINITY_DN21218_c0_g1_i1.p1  ORF type:complete len:328 (-),score=16.26 TRINITY_DN21218_c0_g1_i1:1020-2003(-)